MRQKAYNFSIGRLGALILKEFFQIIRDPSSILISFVLPLFLLFIYGYGVSLDLDHLRIGLLVEDQSNEATSLKRSFLDSSYFDVTEAKNREELDQLITKGFIRGFVVIPSYFSEYLEREDMIAPIQVIADGSETNTANFVHNYAKGAFQVWHLQEVLERSGLPLEKIQTEPRIWYNNEVDSRYFILPGSLSIIITMVGTLLTALVISREWERGTMEGLMSTRVKVLEIILGKLIPYFILGLLTMSLCVGVILLLFQIPFRGSFLLLFLVSMFFLYSALGLGLLISTIARNQVIAYQLAMITGFLPAYILSGFLFEISSMPTWIQYITYFLPARYLVQCFQTLFLVGNVYKLIFINILPMFAIGSVYLSITALKTVKRLD